MDESYKVSFDFVVRIKGSWMNLYRRNKTACFCPYSESDQACGTMCPHFIVENCSVVDQKCSIILTCGKHISRLVEIIE